MPVFHVVGPSLAPASPAAAAARDTDAERKTRVEVASTALLGGRPQAALDAIEPAIAGYDADHATEKRRIYRGMSPMQRLACLMEAASEKTGVVAVGSAYCNALYIKGYALVDLDRPADARATYERIVTPAPMHSHYLAELGQTYRPERNRSKMLELCRQAAGYAELATPDRVKAGQGLAWRCMGMLVEQGKLDKAETLYRKCLKVDPDDAKAKGEIDCVAEQRREKG